MPTQEQAEKAWKHGNKGKKYYDAMTEEQKKAMWQYGYDRKLVDTSKLGPGALSEYQKYVNPSKPEYAMQASIVQAKPKQYYQTQNEKIMSAITPSLVKNMASQAPEQIAAKKQPVIPAPPVKQISGRRLEDIEGNIKQPIPIRTNALDRSQDQYSEGKNFKRSEAVLAGLASAATLGAPNKALQQELKPGQQGYYIAGNIAGSIMPGAGLANAAGKGLAKLGAGKLVQNLGGGAIAGAAFDTTQGIVEGDTGAELAKRVGRGALIGGAIDVATMGAGKLIGKAIQGLKAGKLAKIPIQEAIKADIKPGTNVISQGKYKVKNTALDKAIDDYNKAIETIQNHFGTNELRTDEMARIKTELGIDLDSIVKNMEDAEKGINVREIGQRRNLANVAGVKDLPNINKAVLSPETKPKGINTLPMENKSVTGQINKGIDEAAATKTTVKEIDKIKQVHSTIRNLKQQLDVASNPDEIKALKKELAAQRKTVKEFNNANRQTLVQKIQNLVKNSDNWKDKKGLTGTMRLQREPWDRNIVDIAGEDGKKIKREIFDKIHENEAASTRFKNSSRAKVKALNLSKKESEIVQQVGEGKLAITDIPQGINAQKVQNAVNTFRQFYDEIIDVANDVLIRNGYEPVGKLQNYFPHFDGGDPLMKALGIKLDDMELPTDINGITHTFRPGKQWFGNFIKRTGDKTTFDAVAGFDRYVEGISNIIYHTDDIKTLRTFVDELRLKYSGDEIAKRVADIREMDIPESEKEDLIGKLLSGGNTHLSNAVADLEEYTNVLAGKKDLADRAAERWFGRPIYSIVNNVTNRIGRNMTAISPSSWLTNFIPVTQSLATTSKKAVAQALDDTVKNVVKNDGFVDKSTFLTNRVGSEILDKTVIDKAGDVLSAPFKWIDNFTANVVTRAKYLEGIEKGMQPEEAIRQADDWAAKIMGDRSKGAQPTLFNQRNPITRVLTQFQLEVNNQVSFMLKDLPREYMKNGVNPQSVKALSSVVSQLALYSWLYNEMYEKATGRRPAADIVGIALDLKEDLQNPNLKKSEAGLNLAKNVAETLPFSSTFTGGRIPIGTPLASFGKAAKGAYEVAVGERDAKTGLAQAGKDLAKGAAYIVPPFGGSQIVKTSEGLSAVNQGGVYKTNAAGEKTLQYPIEKNTKNKVQAAIFGKSSLPETRAFYDNKIKALGIDQTKAYEYAVNSGINPKVVYEQIIALRQLQPDKNHKGVTDAQKINSISLNKKLSEHQKRIMIKLFVKTEEGKKLLDNKLGASK
jgi:uncharacterized protein YqeY